MRRIDNEFTGDTRDTLLREARTTFLQQIKTLETAERTLAVLKTLQDNQKKLVTALSKLSAQRPDGVTLH